MRVEGTDVKLAMLCLLASSQRQIAPRLTLFIYELESCEARALVVRSRLGAISMVEIIHLVEAADYTESCTMARCC